MTSYKMEAGYDVIQNGYNVMKKGKKCDVMQNSGCDIIEKSSRM